MAPAPGGALALVWTTLRERYDGLLVQRLDLAPPLDAVASYALAGGKRTRPLLAELVGRVVRAPRAVVTDIAIATEYLHAASMLLDDLKCMDDAAERRSMPTAHRKFSEAQAILTAVAMLSRAYAVLIEAPTGRPQVNLVMTTAACTTVGRSMAPGQAAELERPPVDASGVQAIHSRKTAALFTLVARLTCLVGEAGDEVGAELCDFATDVGMVYQIADDLQDRGVLGEARGNLAHVVGINAAARLAHERIQGARTASRLDTTGSLGALLDWLEQEVTRASTQA
jgi:geranylgeranyl diphosphate synthase type II